jgi:hypothetical protein
VTSRESNSELAAKLPALVPQRHGGALYAGGVPGHAGAGGRPPSAIRERLRGSFEERVTILEEIADDPATDPQDRIRAIDLLAKYGLGTIREMTHDEVRERLRGTLAVIRRNLRTSQAERIVAQLREVWR